MSIQTEQSTVDSLFQPHMLGEIRLANRLVMAPLTRSRAGADNVPGPLACDYYSQRASMGLIIAEATQVSPQAQGYLHVVEGNNGGARDNVPFDCAAL